MRAELVRWVFVAALFSLLPSLVPNGARAEDEQERIAALSEGASDDESALLDQARAALDAAGDPTRDELARERARALADSALSLIEARRAARQAAAAREAAVARRDAAVARRAAALSRRDAATTDLHRREREVAP